jgi:DNA-binding PadR family transcriptional regulator
MDDRHIILPDGGKYDHKSDPLDVTGHMEADPQLCKQMLEKGYVVRWAIDNRYRLTESGQREMARRRELILKARRENSVGPLLPSHEAHARRHFKAEREAEEAEKRLKLIGKEHENG